MRLLDLLIDIQLTSGRIAERDLQLDVDTLAALTLKTLVRPDVTAFFDQLHDELGLTLTPARALVYQVFMFAYTVNVRPRPVYSDMLDIAAKIAKQLNGTTPEAEKNLLLCASPRIKLPSRIVRSLAPIIKLQTNGGLFSQYSHAAPPADFMSGLFAPSFTDASLLLFEAPMPAIPDLPQGQDRLAFAGAIFTTRHYRLNGIYVSSLN